MSYLSRHFTLTCIRFYFSSFSSGASSRFSVRCARSAIDIFFFSNVIKLEHNQFVSTNRNAAVELRVTIEAYGEEHKAQIVDAIHKAGFDPTLVQTSL